MYFNEFVRTIKIGKVLNILCGRKEKKIHFIVLDKSEVLAKYMFCLKIQTLKYQVIST